jgi:hypothetical protein
MRIHMLMRLRTHIRIMDTPDTIQVITVTRTATAELASALDSATAAGIIEAATAGMAVVTADTARADLLVAHVDLPVVPAAAVAAKR